MGVQAYILIQTEVGKAGDVAHQIRELDGVAEADDVTGPYDVIAKAEAETIDELGRMVVSKVQMIDRDHPHAHLPGRQPLAPAPGPGAAAVRSCRRAWPGCRGP